MPVQISDDTEKMPGAGSLEPPILVNKIHMLLLIIALGALFRFYGFSSESLWTDEIGTCWVSSAPSFSELFDRASVTQGQSPFYFAVEKIVLMMLAPSEFSLRIVSLLASLASIAIVFKLGKLYFNDELKALASSLVFAVNEYMIYYAREARPYSLGLMFALLSMYCFSKFVVERERRQLIFYTLFTILTCYCHYVFASIIIAQNMHLIYIRLRHGKENFAGIFQPWMLSQAAVFISGMLLLGQISGILEARESWNWLRILPFYSAAKLFVSVFNPGTLLVLFLCMCIFLALDKDGIVRGFLLENADWMFLLLTWLLIPFIFACAVSYTLNCSLFDVRYLAMSILPFSLLLGKLLCIFKCPVLRIAFPGTYLFIYLGLVLMPNSSATGTFAPRVGHDWKNALKYVKANAREGDAVLLRMGEIKENWLPSPEKLSESNYRIVSDYCSAPFRIFYWNGPAEIPVYSMTYTWEERFYPYYDFLFSQLAKHKRVWLIGVNPPNTNYQMKGFSNLMCREFYWTRTDEQFFSGVHLTLLSSDYIPLKSDK